MMKNYSMTIDNYVHNFLFQAVEYLQNAYYGTGIGVVWTISPQCDGTEERILDCKSTYTNTEYGHSYDVGVRCPGMAIFKLKYCLTIDYTTW